MAHARKLSAKIDSNASRKNISTRGASLSPPQYGMAFIDQPVQRKESNASPGSTAQLRRVELTAKSTTIQLNKKGRWWGSAIGGVVGGVAGAIGGHMYSGISAVKGGLTGMASGAVAGYQHAGITGALGGAVVGGAAGAVSAYYSSTAHGALTGAAVGSAVLSNVADRLTVPGYQLGTVAPDMKPALDRILSTPRGKSLVEGSCERTGLPLNIEWVVSAEAHTGAFYNSHTNTIGVSMGAADEAVEGHILWELQNAQQDWGNIQAEHHLDRNRAAAMSRQDRIRMVYHMEKSEYISLVKQYKQGLQDGRPSSFAGEFNNGKASNWSSFSKYVQHQTHTGHYAKVFPDGALTVHEITALLTADDQVEHNWTTEKEPPLYKRPVELLEFKIQ